MSELIDDPRPGQNAPEFTVTEISGAVKRIIEGNFSHVRIRGEIGRVSRPRSGHVYLDLKDDRSVLSGVIWKGVAARLRTPPEEGLEVVATGRLTTFGGQSKYQIVIEDIAPAGMGALMAMLEKRRKQFEAEGLFDPAHKLTIPFLPDIIGVVTSPSGAVIRDILHRLRDRFPRKVLIWPVAVQGERAAPEIARAIAGFNALTPGGALPRPDLLIVARGGGSIEDLWGFNEEVVVRAAADSRIPLISAVGHETDTTLIDFVADQRAPTPTAAAELAVPVRIELLAGVEQSGGRLTRAVSQQLLRRVQRVRDIARALPRPEQLIGAATQRLDVFAGRLPNALRQAARHKQIALANSSALLRPALLSRPIVTRRQDLGRHLTGLETTMRQQRRDAAHRLDLAGHALDRMQPSRQVAEFRHRFDTLSVRLSAAGQGQLDRWHARIDALERVRRGMGYTETLKRGFAVIHGPDGVLTTKSAAEQASSLEIEFQDGRLRPVQPGPKARQKSAKSEEDPPEQGNLF